MKKKDWMKRPVFFYCINDIRRAGQLEKVVLSEIGKRLYKTVIRVQKHKRILSDKERGGNFPPVLIFVLQFCQFPDLFQRIILKIRTQRLEDL